MTRRVFFSFHYKRDAWRAGQVRNSNVVEKDNQFGFVDAAEWESIEREGDDAIKRWIRGQLKQTSVTVVLIGAQTSERDWVDFEIRESWERGNALLGIRIHNIKNDERQTDVPGANPFDSIYLENGKPLSSVVKTYDWVSQDGRANFGSWVEEVYTAHEAYDGETSLKKSETASPYVRSTPDRAPVVAPPAAPTPIRNPAKPWAR